MKDKVNDSKSKLNNTNLLLEDSTSSNKFYSSYIKRHNNTELLLNDKTSILAEKDSKLKSFNASNNNTNKNNNYPNYKNSDIDNNININLDTSDNLKLSHLKQSEIKIPESFEACNEMALKSLKYEDKRNHYTSMSLSVSLGESEVKSNKLQFSEKSLDFGLVFPGEILHKQVILRSTSNVTEKISINFSQEMNLSSYFINGKIKIKNSNLKYKCFEIKNLINEDIENVYITPYEKLELNIWFKCPKVKSQKKFYSVIHIQQVSSEKESHKHIPRNEDIITLQAMAEIPKLLCLREKQSRTGILNRLEYPLIILNLNCNLPQQRFRIPIKNLSMKDMDLDLYWQNNNNNIGNRESSSELKISNECEIKFDSNRIKVYSLCTAYMEITVKFKKSSNFLNISNDSMLSNEDLKVLHEKSIKKFIHAKLMSTDVIFTFILSAEYI